jgi:crotonobetainyl-CoA:carnitine CoA-transferase CaiB-like acyl-CoA transferase
VIRLLEGVRVLEVGSLFNVDNLGLFLADLGADVIKVELPGRGDYGRDIVGQITPHHSPAHVQLNANKRSVTCNLRTDAGRDVFWKLLDTADVFITGNIADVCDKLGVGYEAQKARKPEIVYCQTTGFGATGPYAKIPTHGYSMNSLAADYPMTMGEDGLVHLDRPGAPLPRKTADATCISGIWGAYFVAAALLKARSQGEGCYIDISGADAVVAGSTMSDAYILNEHRITDAATMPLIDRWSHELTGAKQGHYQTKDGKVVMFACIEPQFWKGFCVAAEREDLLDTHDDSLPVDFQNMDNDLKNELQAIIATKTQAEWCVLAAEYDFVLSPSPRTIREMSEDIHVRERNIFREGEHPHAGPFTYIGVPAVIPGQDFEIYRPAPLLGEQTDELLGELGYTAEQLEELRSAGAI